MLLGADGAPLSKRRGSASVGELRQAGYLPQAVTNYLLRLGHAGAPDEWVEPAAQPATFDLGRVGRAPAHVDTAQLNHWQREAVKRLDPAGLDAWLAPVLAGTLDPGQRRLLGATVSHNVVFPADALPWVEILFGDLPPLGAEAREIAARAGTAFFGEALSAFDETGPDLPALARQVRMRTGRKGADLFMPLRVAITGRTDGPELGPLLAALPAATLRSRIAAQAGPAAGKD